MRPTTFLSLILYALILVGLSSASGGLLVLALPIAVYLLAGVLRAPEDIDLVVARELSAERAGPDTPVEIVVTITNRGAAVVDGLLEDLLPPKLVVIEGAARRLCKLDRGETITLHYTVKGPRGYYGFKGIGVDARDAFGLVRRKFMIPQESQLFILPPVLRLKRVAIRPRKTRVYSGIIPSNVGGSGVEFFGIREHQPGDPPRRINWRASTRNPNYLYANEFMQERVADVGIVLDGRLQANRISAGHSLFEYSVMAAGTLADAFLAQGDRVSLLLYGRFLKWTLPGYGKIQRERILHDLTLAQPGSSEVFSYLTYLPTRLFPSHSQLVLVSPLRPDDPQMLVHLRARGYQLLVISPDPVSFEASYLPKEPEFEQAARILHLERLLLLQEIRQAGIRIINWDVSQPFDRVVQHFLSRPPFRLRTIEGVQ